MEFDVVSAIMDYEAGELTEEQEVELFQHLVDKGTAWALQGSYGRRAKQLIEAGLVAEADDTDWNGSYAPSGRRGLE